MKNRKVGLKHKTSIPADKKPAILECITVDLMSSEEEVMDENNEKYFLVKSLPWRSEYYNQLVSALDEKFRTRQTKKRTRSINPPWKGWSFNPPQTHHISNIMQLGVQRLVKILFKL